MLTLPPTGGGGCLFICLFISFQWVFLAGVLLAHFRSFLNGYQGVILPHPVGVFKYNFGGFFF